MAEEEEDSNVHLVDIRRGNGGFGFNIKGTTQEGGVLQAINGRLYPPLQYVSAVDEGGAAYKAGLRRFDRILSVNDVDTQGANHTKVVELVLRGGGHLVLKVLRVDIKEAARLQRLEEAIEEGKAKGNAVALVQVKSFEDVSNINGTYTIFKIFVKGEYRCSRRYSEFVDLNKELKARFRWFNFPTLPPKKSNGLLMLKGSLDAKDLEDRRVGLDQYLSKVFGVEDIFESDIVKKFLEGDPHIPAHLNAPVPVRSEPDRRSTADATKVTRPTSTAAPAPVQRNTSTTEEQEEEEDAAAAAAAAKQEQARKAAEAKAAEAARAKAAKLAEENAEVKLKVLCANHRLLDVRVKKSTTVGELENDIKEALGLGDFAKNIFGLFICPGEQSATIPDKNAFERKLDPSEKVLQQKGRLLFQRWLFTKAQEQFAEPDAVAIDMLFSQAVDDLERGRLTVVAAAENKLAALKEDGEKNGFLKVARKLEGYATMQFPESSCDFPEEDTAVVVKVNLKNLILQVDDENKTEFPWDVVTECTLATDQKSVVVTYTTDDDEKETINISTQYAPYLKRCIERVFLEREWARAVLKGEEAAEGNFFLCKQG